MIDLRVVIKDLVRFAMTEQEIADCVGTTQATINRLKNKKHNSTTFELGTKLCELHKREKRNYERRIARAAQ